MDYCKARKNNAGISNSGTIEFDIYLSPNMSEGLAMDIIFTPMRKIKHAATQGSIKGSSLIDASCGPFRHLLGPVSDAFNDITLLRSKEECITEVEKWLHNPNGSYDYVTTESARKEKEAKELKLKSAVKRVLKCDLNLDNITDPVVLSPADCVLVLGVVEIDCQNKKGFLGMIRKLAALVKPGGYMVYCGVLEATFYKCDREKYPIFHYNADLVIKALVDSGFTINQSETIKNIYSRNLMDRSGTLFLIAQKRV